MLESRVTNPVSELVGREAGNGQALVRAVIVLGQELDHECRQFRVILPGFVLQPLFERADKAFSAAIRLRQVARNQDMNELLLLHQGAKSGGPKMNTPIRDQEEQFRRKQDFESLDNQVLR